MQIKEQRPHHAKINQVLGSLDWSILAPYKPQLVGTFPLDIDVADSDLDVICTYVTAENFINALMHFKDQASFELERGTIIVCRFKVQGVFVEIYASQEDSHAQNGYRHMMVEAQCLSHYGQDFKQEIRKLKTMGLKTEPAFALLLNLYGNPYQRLLEEDWTYPEQWHNPLEDLDLEIHQIHYLALGWSHDLKLVAETDQGRVLIRMTPLETHERKWQVFQQMSQITSQSVALPHCLEYQRTDRIIAVFKWVEGEDLTYQLKDMPPDRQYALGVAAGQGLRDIQVPAPPYDWYKTYTEKIERVIQNYKDCGIVMDGSDQVISYIMRHKVLLKDRPIVFQHGDYHVGNMVLSKDQTLGIVDFNRSSTGDPWEEYDRFVFTWQVSPFFAYGQLKGYFGQIPETFFKLMALYNGLNALSAIPWAIPYGPKDVAVMKANYHLIMDQYDGFTSHIPKWFKWADRDYGHRIEDK